MANQVARQAIVSESQLSPAHVVNPIPAPLEIWRLVLEFLRVYGPEHIARVATIHPALLGETESVLYRDLHITSFGQAVKLESAVSRAVPRCGQAVRQLRVVVSRQDKPDASNYRLVMRRLLDKLPRLVTLKFWRPVMSLPGFTLPMLVYGKQLLIRRLSGGFLCLTVTIAQFLHAHPELEEVRLTRFVTEKETRIFQLLMARQVAFENFKFPKLHTLGCNHGLLVQIHNPRNITRLYVTQDRPQSEMVEEIIRILGAQLISLRVDFEPRSILDLNYSNLRDYRWERCPRLKFLHIDDGYDGCVRPPADPADDYGYGAKDCMDSKLPPVLETLVWAPSWTRYSRFWDTSDAKHDSYLRAIRHFSEALLRDTTSVREVVYSCLAGDYFHCSLSPPET